MRNWLICFLISLLMIAGVSAEIPITINYQGKITNHEGVALDGIYTITFRLYDDSLSGLPLWGETHEPVLIVNGLFDVLLGSISRLELRFDISYWIELQVSDEIFSPRIALNSVPYSFRAMWVDSIEPSAINWDTLNAYSDTTHLHRINDLSDVDFPDLGDGWFLRYNLSSDSWYADSIDTEINWDTLDAYSDTTHSHNIEDLSNVEITDLEDGWLLRYDGTSSLWYADSMIEEIDWDTLSAYSDTTHGHQLSLLDDVDTTGIEPGYILIY